MSILWTSGLLSKVFCLTMYVPIFAEANKEVLRAVTEAKE